MKIHLLLVQFFICLSLSAQSEMELKDKAEKSNTAASWNDLAEYYAEHDDSIRLKIAVGKALLLANQSNNQEETGRALMYKGEYERILNGRFTEHYVSLLNQAATLLTRKKSKYAANCLHKLSQKYNTAGEHNKALGYLFKAADESMLHNQEEISAIYCDIGYAYLYKGVPDSARIYTLKALHSATVRKDTLSMTVSYSLLGIMSRRENKFIEALGYYQKGAELYRQQKEWTRLATTWCNIAVLYTDWEKYDQAIEFANKAIETVNANHLSDKELSRALLILGPPLLSTNQAQKAIEVYKRALPGLNVSYQKRSCLFGLTKAYYKLDMKDSVNLYMQKLEEEFVQSKAMLTDSYFDFKGLIALREQDFNKAIEYYEKGLDLRSRKKGGILQRNSVDLYLNLSMAYEKGPQDYKKALHYKSIALVLQDSIYQQKHNELMSEYYARFETTEKELEINRLQIQKQKSHYQFILLIGGFSSIVILLGIAWLYNRILLLKKEKEATLLSQRVEQKENEFLLLQQETEQRLTRKYIDGLETERERLATELHDDVCNSMLALEMNIRTEYRNRNLPVPATVETLSEIRNRVRNVSHELMPPVFQYATIDEMLEDFITHLNLPTETKARYISTPGIQWENIPPEIGFEFYRIVQEAVNNALKYASAHTITIELKLDEKNLSVSITDDGSGFDTEKKTKGIGLYTIAQRIQSVNGKFTLTSHPNKGTRVEVYIEL